MSSQFSGYGNLGAAPELRYAPVGGENKPVAALRVFFDRRVPDGEGGFTEKGGHWRNVSYWGQRAEHAVKVLQKGMRIRVEGDLVHHEWIDGKSGEERSDLVINANSIDIALVAVESVVRRQSQEKLAQPDLPQGPSDFDDDIPF